MPESARITDYHSCPSFEPGPTPHTGGPIASPCSPDVEIEKLAAARGSSGASCDFAMCMAGGPDFIAQGSGTVLINNMHATRVGDKTEHNGVIVGHASTVEVGGPTVTLRTIKQRTAAGTSNATKPDATQNKGDANSTPKSLEQQEKEKEEKAKKTRPKAIITQEDILQATESPSILQFRCDSYDPDNGPAVATPDLIVSRAWSLDGVPGSVSLNVSDRGGIRRVVSFSTDALLGQNRKSSFPPKVNLLLTVENASGESDTTIKEITIKAWLLTFKVVGPGELPGWDNGHAALELLHADGTRETWGAWGTSNSNDVIHNNPDDMIAYPHNLTRRIYEHQYNLLKSIVGKGFSWSYVNNCTNFAGDTFNTVTGENVDYSSMGIGNPKETAGNIDAENKRP